MKQDLFRTATMLALSLGFIGADVAAGQKPPAYAFKNVQLHMADGSIQKGNIVWRDGIIESVGPSPVPFDAFSLADGGDSLHVYPGFIDGSASWGSPEWPRDLQRPPRMGEPSNVRAGIQPDRLPSTVLKFENAWMDKARKAGFTQFASSLEGKLMPGAVEVFHLYGTDPKIAIAREAFAQKIQFEAADVYPSTLMAMMAKIRQLWYDAAALQEHQQLYASAPGTTPLPAKDPVLEALFPVLQKKQTVYFHADSKEDIERVLKLKKELGFELVLVSAREGWMLKEELAKQKVSVIATLNVADKPKFMADTTKKAASKQPSDEEKAFNARQESAWKAELNNIKELQKAGVKVGVTTNGVKPDDLRKKFDLFLQNGYEEKELVSLLTRQTAEILGLGAVSGDLKKGMQAHFTLMNKPFKDSKATVQHHVVAGKHKNLSQTDTSAVPVMRRPRTLEVE